MHSQQTFKALQNIFPTIKINIHPDEIQITPHYKTAYSIFNFLCKLQRDDGAIVDPLTHSPLDGQYHYGNVVLSAILFYAINSEPWLYQRALRTLSYLMRIPPAQQFPAVDFTNFPLLIGTLCLPNHTEADDLGVLLHRYIANIQHRADLTAQHSYGNNFIALRAVNHLLRYKIGYNHHDKAYADKLITATLQWQFSDGIFYDYPRAFNYSNGIPSLTYHAKITLMVLLYGLISNDDHTISCALRGLDALATLMAADGEACYYGRSNNALYGYACGILAYRLAAQHLKTGEKAYSYATYASKLYAFATAHRAPDGHLCIVPNPNETERCGYDGYMHVTVYNAFMMSLLLLSAYIQEITPPQPLLPECRVTHLTESGFLVIKGSATEMAFNLKGHNVREQYLLDPRYSCGTPLFLRFCGKDLLPTIPFTYPVNTLAAASGMLVKIARQVQRAIATMQSWEYLQKFNPLHAGFLPCIETTSKLLVPLHVSSVDIMQAQDVILLKLSGNLTSILRNGIFPLLVLLGELVAAVMKVPLHRLRQALVRKTKLRFERRITIGNDFLHFSESLPVIPKGSHFFTLRTYATWHCDHSLDYAHFSDKGYSLIVALQPGEKLQKYTSAGSSKGWVNCWKVKSCLPDMQPHHELFTCEHTVIFSHQASSQQTVRDCILRVREKLLTIASRLAEQNT